VTARSARKTEVHYGVQETNRLELVRTAVIKLVKVRQWTDVTPMEEGLDKWTPRRQDRKESSLY
jgi:hypothetical protein